MAVHPKSLLNLKPGSDTSYKEPKRQRSITVTDTGWLAIKEKARQELGLSVSEVVELLGRGKFKLVKVETQE